MILVAVRCEKISCICAVIHALQLQLVTNALILQSDTYEMYFVPEKYIFLLENLGL